MKRAYYPFWEWEDYQNGMYSDNLKSHSNTEINLAVALLSDPVEFERIALELTQAWPICTRQNLTNTSCNRKAWIGQAAVNYKHDIQESTTRLAWKMLTADQRNNANNVANKIIEDYENQD